MYSYILLSGLTALHEAVIHGFYEVIVDLIKSGAQVNTTADNGDTPLHDAIANGHMKVGNLQYQLAE